MSNFLKRIQRDRDEQLSHRQQDSKILIQRNRNMLQDQNQRHVLEYKKTVDFLKFALGNRAPTKNKTFNANASMVSSSMKSASMMHNQSRLSSGPSGIKARQRSLLQAVKGHTSNSVTRLPAISGLSRAAALQDNGNSMMGHKSMKARHKSIALNNSSIGGNQSRMRVQELNNQSSMFVRNNMNQNGRGLSSEIDDQPIDVRIDSTDNRIRSQAKVSKLPHLMAHKQSKSSIGTQKRQTGRQAKPSHDESMPTDPYSDAGSGGGILFMEGNDAPNFSPASGGQHQEGIMSQEQAQSENREEGAQQ